MAAVARDWRRAPLSAADHALAGYAERLARTPWEIDPAHVECLREAGFDDRAISDAAQVVSYFSYINRIADGLGVDLEDLPPFPGDADAMP